MFDPILSLWLLACCQHFGVEYNFAKAVMLVESGGKMSGPIDSKGRYWAPMGIAACFKKQYPIENPYVNVMLGVRALRGQDKRKVLRRYNTAFNEPYYRAVMAAYRRGQR